MTRLSGTLGLKAMMAADADYQLVPLLMHILPGSIELSVLVLLFSALPKETHLPVSALTTLIFSLHIHELRSMRVFHSLAISSMCSQQLFEYDAYRYLIAMLPTIWLRHQLLCSPVIRLMFSMGMGLRCHCHSVR